VLPLHFAVRDDAGDVLVRTAEIAADAERARLATAYVEHLKTGAGRPDTLAQWLFKRFGMVRMDWGDLSEDGTSYWEHEADAVRRAVDRGGFR
jgi:hypothetical protein